MFYKTWMERDAEFKIIDMSPQNTKKISIYPNANLLIGRNNKKWTCPIFKKKASYRQ